MPPRFAYWTIILDGAPTSFRTKERDEILPLFNQLKAKNPAALLKWFSAAGSGTRPSRRKKCATSRKCAGSVRNARRKRRNSANSKSARWARFVRSTAGLPMAAINKCPRRPIPAADLPLPGPRTIGPGATTRGPTGAARTGVRAASIATHATSTSCLPENRASAGRTGTSGRAGQSRWVPKPGGDRSYGDRPRGPKPFTANPATGPTGTGREATGRSAASLAATGRTVTDHGAEAIHRQTRRPAVRRQAWRRPAVR